MEEIRQIPSIGVIFHPWFPPESLVDYARKVEAAGFDELWLWDDCFQTGAFTAAGIALSSTSRIKVGIGLLPVPACNPLFAAMEITTLERAFPDRFLPGFGHGVRSWMERIGAAPPSPLLALEETVTAVRALLQGKKVTTHGSWVNLEQVQMQLTLPAPPPIYIGGIREKTLRLAGRLGDGSILTGQSSPAYIQWAKNHIRSGMEDSGRTDHRVAVYVDVIVSPDRAAARSAARQALAGLMPWEDAKLEASGIAAEVRTFLKDHTTPNEFARNMPDAWVDELCAAGTPQEVADGIRRRAAAGADSIIFELLNSDPSSLDDYIQYLSPVDQLIN